MKRKLLKNIRTLLICCPCDPPFKRDLFRSINNLNPIFNSSIENGIVLVPYTAHLLQTVLLRDSMFVQFKFCVSWKGNMY